MNKDVKKIMLRYYVISAYWRG